MSGNNFARIETLNKENYDTWKMQMEAMLTKNDVWNYVNGKTKKPEATKDPASLKEIEKWERQDAIAKSDIILSISPSELKQIKGCATAREVWLKLEGIYQSKGPARKATLLKQLTLQRMEEDGEVREHLQKFFDAVDKLSEMEVDVNPDLLAIMLLYSLPSGYENFRCAIESRDELPSPENLRVKIIEESEARKSEIRTNHQNALFVKKNSQQNYQLKKNGSQETFDRRNKEVFRFRCHKCREVGHKAANCKRKKETVAKFTEDESFTVSEANYANKSVRWCLDSGATSHLCKNIEDFTDFEKISGRLNLANEVTTNIKGEQLNYHQTCQIW